MQPHASGALSVAHSFRARICIWHCAVAHTSAHTSAYGITDAATGCSGRGEQWQACIDCFHDKSNCWCHHNSNEKFGNVCIKRTHNDGSDDNKTHNRSIVDEWTTHDDGGGGGDDDDDITNIDTVASIYICTDISSGTELNSSSCTDPGTNANRSVSCARPSWICAAFNDAYHILWFAFKASVRTKGQALGVREQVQCAAGLCWVHICSHHWTLSSKKLQSDLSEAWFRHIYQNSR